MRNHAWLLVLLAIPLLTGCALTAVTPVPVTLSSRVPTESFDRTDMPCYYGVVW